MFFQIHNFNRTKNFIFQNNGPESGGTEKYPEKHVKSTKEARDEQQKAQLNGLRNEIDTKIDLEAQDKKVFAIIRKLVERMREKYNRDDDGDNPIKRSITTANGRNLEITLLRLASSYTFVIRQVDQPAELMELRLEDLEIYSAWWRGEDDDRSTRWWNPEVDKDIEAQSARIRHQFSRENYAKLNSPKGERAQKYPNYIEFLFADNGYTSGGDNNAQPVVDRKGIFDAFGINPETPAHDKLATILQAISQKF